MIPIKIHCGCGQHYAFDIEPVGGCMPSSVACPACGADGTRAANEMIAQHVAAPSAPTPVIRARSGSPLTLSPSKPIAAGPQQNRNHARAFGKIGGYIGIAAMFAFPRGGGILVMAMVGAICGGGGAALGHCVGLLVDAVNDKPATLEGLPDKTGLAVASLVLGILALMAWLIPLIGLPVAIAGFVLGWMARVSINRVIALIGMGLSLFGLLFSCGNGYLGAMLAVRAVLARH